MTQLRLARKGIISPEMKDVAQNEGLSEDYVRTEIANGRLVITRNKKRCTIKPLGIGHGLRTKINANIGTSQDHVDIDIEIEKMKIAVRAGADTIMDLSTGGNIGEIRKGIIKDCPVPVGTVPIYQAVVEARNKLGKSFVEMTADDIFRVIEQQAEDGVDFMTLHCGVTRQSLERMQSEGRIMDVVSRGGSFTLEWIKYNQRENPLFEYYDRLLDIADAYDITLSLGDGFRPGCIADATDRGQIMELIQLGELTQRAWAHDVQVIIEGPGHVPMHQIEANVLLQKRLCHGAPFYVLGPLVTDVAPGYDHIVGAIGGAIAARAGADFLCYVTPSEHLRLPTKEDVEEGVIASRIAAHAADIAKNVTGAWDWDRQMAYCRKNLDWRGQIRFSINPSRAEAIRASSPPSESDVCTMCGEYCAIKLPTRQKDASASKH